MSYFFNHFYSVLFLQPYLDKYNVKLLPAYHIHQSRYKEIKGIIKRDAGTLCTMQFVGDYYNQSLINTILFNDNRYDALFLFNKNFSKILGFVIVKKISEQKLHLSLICTIPKTGIPSGTLLLSSLIYTSIYRQIEYIDLDVAESSNWKGRCLYEKFGFTSVGLNKMACGISSLNPEIWLQRLSAILNNQHITNSNDCKVFEKITSQLTKEWVELLMHEPDKQVELLRMLFKKKPLTEHDLFYLRMSFESQLEFISENNLYVDRLSDILSNTLRQII